MLWESPVPPPRLPLGRLCFRFPCPGLSKTGHPRHGRAMAPLLPHEALPVSSPGTGGRAGASPGHSCLVAGLRGTGGRGAEALPSRAGHTKSGWCTCLGAWGSPEASRGVTWHPGRFPREVQKQSLGGLRLNVSRGVWPCVRRESLLGGGKGTVLTPTLLPCPC